MKARECHLVGTQMGAPRRGGEWFSSISSCRSCGFCGFLEIHSSQKMLQTSIFIFRTNFQKYCISVTSNSISGLISRIALRVFVCDSRNYMENCLIIIFLENRISVTQKNVFRRNFAIISYWCLSVNSPALILSKNSGVFSAKNRLKSAQNWLKLAKFGSRLAK